MNFSDLTAHFTNGDWFFFGALSLLALAIVIFFANEAVQGFINFWRA